MEKCNLNFQPAVSKRNETRILAIAFHFVERDRSERTRCFSLVSKVSTLLHGRSSFVPLTCLIGILEGLSAVCYRKDSPISLFTLMFT